MPKTTIPLETETRKKLNILKAVNDFRDYDELLKWMIKKVDKK
ncbi:MAG: hypothetical protein OQK82_02045 [Candidatus Pacearchaeota archaeon]|nr:hypothetical protein [Candidatus Pacearchaeota archaeon]